MINIKTSLSIIARLASTLSLVLLLTAWVTPVEMDTDLGEPDSGFCFDGNPSLEVSTLCHSVNLSIGRVDRCDTNINAYFDDIPTQCHRRNLIWKLHSVDVLSQWNPELGIDANWRLPTIKELARLVDYGNAARVLSGELLMINMLADTSIDTSWLISSTYRDIVDETQPSNGSGNAQIFGIHMKTGEIAAFDTEGVYDLNGKLTGTSLKKCGSLNNSGVCSLSDASVYALLVRTQTVTELM